MKLFKDPQPDELTLTYFSAAIYSPSDVSSLLREVKYPFTLIMLKWLCIRNSATAGETIILSFGQNMLDTVLVVARHVAFMCGSSLTFFVLQMCLNVQRNSCIFELNNELLYQNYYGCHMCAECPKVNTPGTGSTMGFFGNWRVLLISFCFIVKPN